MKNNPKPNTIFSYFVTLLTGVALAMFLATCGLMPILLDNEDVTNFYKQVSRDAAQMVKR